MTDVLQQVAKDLVVDEGFRTKPYRCTAGKWTVGIGRNYEDNPFTTEEITLLLTEGVTEKTAQILVMNELKISAGKLLGLFPDFLEYPSDVRRVLLNMHFNLGHAGLLKLTSLIENVKKRDWVKAAERMATFAWRKQVGQRAERLIKLMRNAR